jgi:hypothetical protein
MGKPEGDNWEGLFGDGGDIKVDLNSIGWEDINWIY